jgi:hypothetical protein
VCPALKAISTNNLGKRYKNFTGELGMTPMGSAIATGIPEQKCDPFGAGTEYVSAIAIIFLK